MIAEDHNTIAICGDSWFTVDSNHPQKSFGEILCNKNNWDLQSLAINGCSNFCIRLQVDRAIEKQADFIVIGTTTQDRGEIPIINKQNSHIWDKLKNSFNWHDWFTLQPEMYVKSRGLDNIQSQNPAIVSQSYNNMLFQCYNSSKNLPPQQLESLKSYVLNLYDKGVKQQTDSWIISDACRVLTQHGIPFLIFIESLYQWDYSHDIEWVPEKNVVRPRDFSVWNDVPKSDKNGSFHYCSEQGGNVFAHYVETRIKELL